MHPGYILHRDRKRCVLKGGDGVCRAKIIADQWCQVSVSVTQQPLKHKRRSLGVWARPLAFVSVSSPACSISGRAASAQTTRTSRELLNYFTSAVRRSECVQLMRLPVIFNSNFLLRHRANSAEWGQASRLWRRLQRQAYLQKVCNVVY